MKALNGSANTLDEPKQNLQAAYDFPFDGSMHLPQLFSQESTLNPPFLAPSTINTMNIECSQNLLRLTSNGCGGLFQNDQRFHGDWSFLDKLLASHHGNAMDHHRHHHHHQSQSRCHPSSQYVDVGTSTQKFAFHHYLGCETDVLKFSK